MQTHRRVQVRPGGQNRENADDLHPPLRSLSFAKSVLSGQPPEDWSAGASRLHASQLRKWTGVEPKQPL
jgi:hypothetical protein